MNDINKECECFFVCVCVSACENKEVGRERERERRSLLSSVLVHIILTRSLLFLIFRQKFKRGFLY